MRETNIVRDIRARVCMSQQCASSTFHYRPLVLLVNLLHLTVSTLCHDLTRIKPSVHNQKTYL